MSRLATWTIATTLLLALSGCTSAGEDDDGDFDLPDASQETSAAPDPTASSDAPEAAPTGPDCEGVWVTGQVLPKTYTTCQADGEAAEQEVFECTDGTSLIVFSDRFYGVTGQTILEPADAPLQDTDEFGAAYSACTGE